LKQHNKDHPIVVVIDDDRDVRDALADLLQSVLLCLVVSNATGENTETTFQRLHSYAEVEWFESLSHHHKIKNQSLTQSSFFALRVELNRMNTYPTR
jgi:hypothetical protein